MFDCLRDCALLSLPTVHNSSVVAGQNSGAHLLKMTATLWHTVWSHVVCPATVLHQHNTL